VIDILFSSTTTLSNPFFQMPQGQTPLEPDVKQQHCEDSLKRYSKKQVQIFSIFLLRTDIILLSCRNADKLHEAARLRMQRWVPQILVLYSPILVDQGITAVTSSDIFTQRKYARKVALASERYRDRLASKWAHLMI
jgi:hypothetical protein